MVGPTNKTLNAEYFNELGKLDSNAADGLGGVPDSLAYRVGEIERHIHSYAKSFGASPGGVAPGLMNSLTGFRVTSGAVANTFGAWTAIFDGSETPVMGANLYFDPHRIIIDGVQNNNKSYRLRLAFSEGATFATANLAVAGGAYTDVILHLSNDVNRMAVPIVIQAKRQERAGKIWAALATADAVAQWLDFSIEIHEYEG